MFAMVAEYQQVAAGTPVDPPVDLRGGQLPLPAIVSSDGDRPTASRSAMWSSSPSRPVLLIVSSRAAVLPALPVGQPFVVVSIDQLRSFPQARRHQRHLRAPRRCRGGDPGLRGGHDVRLEVAPSAPRSGRRRSWPR
jgi:hypothetical protein